MLSQNVLTGVRLFPKTEIQHTKALQQQLAAQYIPLEKYILHLKPMEFFQLTLENAMIFCWNWTQEPTVFQNSYSESKEYINSEKAFWSCADPSPATQ